MFISRFKIFTAQEIISNAFCGMIGAFAIGAVIQRFGPALFSSQPEYNRATSAFVGGVVLLLIWAGVQRFTQARRDAGERTNLAAAGKAAPDKLDKLAPLAPLSPAEPEPTRTRIFISYRREGEAAQAGRIADLLGSAFGPDHVFMDVDAIRLGVDFVEVINEEVAKCDVLLALIGRVTGSTHGMRLASEFLITPMISCASKSRRH
jgi:uncharacterized membrane protein YeaQ/YmgE (transglycosylase-associated protein family)